MEIKVTWGNDRLRLPGFILFVSLLVVSYGGSGFAQDRNMNTEVQKDRLRADVKTLTDIVPPRNHRNTSSLNRAADYIMGELRKLGCDLTVQPFTVRGADYKNVICSFGNPEAERVVVGAHYDVAGETPGADDNASGVAGLLELARLVSEAKPELPYRLDFVAYSLEEPPFFRSRDMGSYFHAKSLADTNAKVKAMLCLESIGYFSDEPDSQTFPAFFLRWFYPDRGNFIVVVGKWGQGDLVRTVRTLMSEAAGIHVDSITAPVIVPGIDFSDHRSYWKFDYPAVMITDTAFYRNYHYHELSDTIETLDFDRMAEVVKGIYRAITGLGQ
jgi:hypothetical protein